MGRCLLSRGAKCGQEWVQTQRTSKKKGGLESMGFGWDPLEAQWEAMFALLETYVKREGHCNAPQRHKEDGENLGTWENSQRTSKRKGGLRADRVRRLEDLGIFWRAKQQCILLRTIWLPA
jgi:hypothetical protein